MLQKQQNTETFFVVKIDFSWSDKRKKQQFTGIQNRWL